MKAAPVLQGDARRAVEHRGGHLQIIAAAGSGKTEVVSQRVASLLADGVAPRSIVAFTFTERAAEELRQRIAARAQELLGDAVVDRLGGLSVGTIHAYCFRLLQQYVPRYETYDVLDDNQLTAFLSREGKFLGVRVFDPQNRLFASIERFRKALDVVENELLEPGDLPEPLRSVLRDYYAALERYRLLTYGQQVVRAVRELERPEIAARVHADLRHLVVDEYQDVNPAQERLIELLAGPQVELCIVGDDDQAIYQWRGSDVNNIVTFRDRYPAVASYEITTNRRSLPTIVSAANGFARSIPGRLDKTMQAARVAGHPGSQLVVWNGATELDEAGWVASLILDFAARGVPFRDMAVLVRGRAAYPRLMEQFATFDIPVQPGGRAGLFEQPEALLLGRTVCWLADIEWRSPYERGETVTEDGLLDGYEQVFGVSGRGRVRLRALLRDWRQAVPREDRRADLVGELYELLDELDVRALDLADPQALNRMGTLARFSALLAEHESVWRRARPDADVAGEQVGGRDRGSWYYASLAIHLVNYAQGSYEGFDGEADFVLDAVDLTTVHRAKGLEWPVVFVPSVTASRFPTSNAGRPQNWLVPRALFPADRYEGGDADERRLFYVALTRARDWVSVSRHDRVNVRTVGASPYWNELSAHAAAVETIAVPSVETRGDDDDAPITLTYSELAAYLQCGLAFRLRNMLGFQPRLAPELGYGKAVHHVMRTVAEHTRASGRVPSPRQVDEILDLSFFLPAANKPAHRQLKDAARRLVHTYTAKHADDLYRVWETERPFELHLDGVVVTGRADVILDKEGGVPTALAIVDYKTSTRGVAADHALQLQVYADAGRREGLDVRGAYVHDLKAAQRQPVDVGTPAIAGAEATVKHAVRRLRARDYDPQPGPACRGCEVRKICPAGGP